jgi:hypothetical protein
MALLATMMLLLATAGTADAMGGVHAGVKGGMNIANQSVSENSIEQADWRNGLVVGGWLRVPMSPMLSIQPEALFSMKGDRDEDNGVTTKMEYFEVPVLARLGFSTGMPAQPALFAGPSFGFNISAKSDIEGVGEIDVKDSAKTMDMGIVFGGGLEFHNVGIDVRYTKGLSNIADTDGADVKNNVLSILGTIRFL